MCADPGHSAFVQDNNLVCIHDRADTLSNQNNSGMGGFLFEGGSQLGVRFEV